MKSCHSYLFCLVQMSWYALGHGKELLDLWAISLKGCLMVWPALPFLQVIILSCIHSGSSRICKFRVCDSETMLNVSLSWSFQSLCSRQEGYNFSEPEQSAAIKLLDKNGDKLIQFNEFVDWWQNEVRSNPFRLFANNAGKIVDVLHIALQTVSSAV